MSVDNTDLAFSHEGRTVHFGSAGCRATFAANPTAARPARAAAAPSVAEGTMTTCPMHPDVLREGPGLCPLCGMALEPLVARADDGPTDELADMSRRFGGATRTLPLVVLDLTARLPAVLSPYGQCALATPVVLWAG